MQEPQYQERNFQAILITSVSATGQNRVNMKTEVNIDKTKRPETRTPTEKVVGSKTVRLKDLQTPFFLV